MGITLADRSKSYSLSNGQIKKDLSPQYEWGWKGPFLVLWEAQAREGRSTVDLQGCYSILKIKVLLLLMVLVSCPDYYKYGQCKPTALLLHRFTHLLGPAQSSKREEAGGEPSIQDISI